MGSGDARQVQMALEPPPVVSARLDVTYDVRARRSYIGLTLKDHGTGVPLAILAHPWAPGQSIEHVATAARALLVQALRDVCDPDPF